MHLGTLVVDNSSTPPTITLRLPKEAEGGPDRPKRRRDELDTHGIPQDYRVDMRQADSTDDRVRNKFIFSEQQRTWVGQPGGGESSTKKRRREKGGW